MRWAAEEQGYPVAEACRALHISRAGYYQWRSGKAGVRTMENRRLAGLVKQIHNESPDMGYRRIRDDLARYYATPINDKRALRICRSLGVRSTIKYARHGCTRRASDPQYLAENVLNRQFYADKPNEKWLTDVTEFKYYMGPTVHKLYLSAILDLCDRRIVSFVLRDTNDSTLVHETLDVNDKRVLRICRVKDIKSTIKYANQGCTRRAKNPQYVAENLLNRQFHADKPNEKWLTDVTEFKWYEGAAVHKIYLSAILDLYDRRIVAAVVGDSNDNPLVFKTFDKAVKANPDAHPLFHSDRGFQYTSRDFHRKLEQAGMTQSMSRIAHCIDNGPMEGFWGILKRERYYGRRFTSKQELTQMIVNYIRYYNTRRVQRSLGILTPMEKHELYLAA